MPRQFSRILADLRREIISLASQRDRAEAEAARQSGEAEKLRAELAECRRQLELARMETDFLVVSHRLADDPEHLVSARRRLQRMIAKIDRCVSLLKDDADIS